MGKRRRSEFSKEDCFGAVEAFSKRVVRMASTSDAGMFRFESSGAPPMGEGHINVQIMINGEFGDQSDFFEALRVLSGAVLPRKSKPNGAGMDKFGIIELSYDVPARMDAPVMYQSRVGRVVGTSGHYVVVEFSDGSSWDCHPQSLRWLEDDPIKEGE